VAWQRQADLRPGSLATALAGDEVRDESGDNQRAI
jgi:hypothetical protein